MMKPKKQKFNSFEGFVYSTNPDYQPDQVEDTEADTPVEPKLQLLHLHRETKGRGGKAVVIVRGFQGNSEGLNDLGKALKAHCGTGGSVKDGEIIIQGDQRSKVEEYLLNKGYRTKKIGG